MTYYVSPRRQMARRLAQMTNNRYPDIHIPVDVIVDGDDYLITAYVPGIAAEDVKIEVLENTVSISGEFAVEETENAEYLLRERPSGSFSRKLRLPLLMDTAKAEAEVKDGVLSLRVPQAEETKAKQIKVKVK